MKKVIIMIGVHIFEAALQLSNDKKAPLLDVSKHWFKLRKIKNPEKRGRPDILHRSLIALLDSPLNKVGKLRVSFSTVSNPDVSYVIDPSLRIPRSYNRFVGLFAELLRNGEIKSGLIKKMNTRNILEGKKIYLLSSRGEKIGFQGLLDKIKLDDKQLFLIGGFQKGEWEKPLPFNEKISIYDQVLSSSQVCAIITTLGYLKYEMNRNQE